MCVGIQAKCQNVTRHLQLWEERIYSVSINRSYVLLCAKERCAALKRPLKENDPVAWLVRTDDSLKFFALFWRDF